MLVVKRLDPRVPAGTGSPWGACSPSPSTATVCGSGASPAWPHSTRASLAGSGRRLFVPLAARPARPLRGVSGIVQTADGELWLNGADGVTRIPASEVRRALVDSGYQVQYERLDYRDGLEPPAQQIRPLPSATAGTDGRIWFASEGGIAWVDPRQVRRNPVPPPVHLRILTAGGRRYFLGESAGDTVRLPPRMKALSVEYTAYSLAMPDRVRFKYRLEGLEDGWQDAGGRREAFFTNLPPGQYRFHVIASNDDGVWNTAGASLAFTIAPAWNQTWWFFGLVVPHTRCDPGPRRGRVAAPPRPSRRGAHPGAFRGDSRGANPRRPRAARHAAQRPGWGRTATGGRRRDALLRATATPRPSPTSYRVWAPRPGKR